MAEPNFATVAQLEPWPPFQPFEPDPEAMFMLLTEDDLPYEDDETMETDRHLKQMILLLECLELHWAGRENWYAGGDMFLYFSPRQIKSEHFRGPDFFAVLGVPHRERKSYVVWQEGKPPDVIIELLSDKTRAFDKKGKKEIYQDTLRVPEYFWFDPYSYEWAGFALRDGQYEPIQPDERGRLICKRLGLALVQREGRFQNFGGTWLRWETLDGQLLPSAEETARAAQHEAGAEKEKAEAAQREAEAEREKVEAAQRKAEAAQRKADAEKEKAEAAQRKADAEKEKAEAAQRKAEFAQREADAEKEKANAARREKQLSEQRAAELEAMLAKYQAQFGKLPE